MRRASWLIALLLLLSGCSIVDASGNIVTQTRDVAGFTSIDVSSGLNLLLTVAPGSDTSVVVRYDDNVIDNVITRLDGDRLIIEYDGNVNFGDGDRAVEVSMPSLERLKASGGTAVFVTGSVASYSLDASGGSAVDAESFIAERVDLDASGGATVAAYASVAAVGDASGGATVAILGDPAQFDIDSSGGANVGRD